MPPVAVVTDSDASLPPAWAARYGIVQTPITIHFGQETYYAGVDIDDAAVFARIDRDGRLPTTAAPAPGAFASAFETALASGASQVLCFCVSSEVSASYSAALAARDLLPAGKVTVVDTRSLSLGQGYMVLAAAEAAAAGASMAEALARAEDVGRRSYLYAALSTLKYLAMSGRIGHLMAGVAGLLNVRPILTIKDGKLDLLERVRIESRAWARVLELAGERAAGRGFERLAVIHVAASDSAQSFARLAREAWGYTGELPLVELTPGLSVHAGSGLVGVAFTVAS